VVIILLIACWHAAITWRTYSYMRDNMVTKDQMKAFKLELTLEYDDRYVRVNTPPHAHSHAARAGG
jgi:hypothetical protein